jgi:hypothetical protein
MCRYAWHNYRDHFACFECRKAYKYWQWGLTDETEFAQKQKLQHVPREIVCPDCKRPMVDMGLDFKAPRRSDLEAWEILRVLHENGFAFHGCGCDAGGVVPPRTLRELSEWLEKHQHTTEAEKVLQRFEAKAT